MAARRLKTSIALFGAALIAAGSFGACSSDDDDGSGNGDGDGVPNLGLDGGGTGDGSSNSDGGCGDTVIDAEQRPVNILIVLDKSSSMTDTPTGFADDKWTAMRTALSSALTEVQDLASFGLDLYPTSGSCDLADGDPTVAVGPGTTTVPNILTALEQEAPAGGTPTAAALGRALDYFTSGAGQALEGDKYVLLATDGGPNCSTNTTLTCGPDRCTTNIDGLCPMEVTNCCAGAANSSCLDDTGTAAAAKALADAGIPTIVVGIPGTEDYTTTLNAVASAGGFPNPNAPPTYFAVEASGGVSGLTDVLTAITTSLIKTCRFQLTSDPPDLGLLNVTIDGELISKSDPNGGWTIDETTDPPTVELLGTTCAVVEQQGAQSVAIRFGCPTVR